MRSCNIKKWKQHLCKVIYPQTGLMNEDEFMESTCSSESQKYSDSTNVIYQWPTKNINTYIELKTYLVCLSVHYGFIHISWIGKLCLKICSRILIDISMVRVVDVNLASDRSSLSFMLGWLTHGNSVPIFIRGNIISYTHMTEPIQLMSQYGLRTGNTFSVLLGPGDARWG